jgi:FixJ family two-component response regulator
MQEDRIVVVVDDHVDTAEALGLVLESAGFRTSVFTSSLRFLAEFSALDPALVVLDLAMPECDGLQVLRRLRTEIATSVPVIVFSAHVDSTDVRELRRLGVVDVLKKPTLIATLLETVRRGLAPASRAEDGPTPDREQQAAKLPPRRD